ncbi:hypothetical protein B9G98_03234 [Wickerhamiella sorbophila]|uniref:DUF202 domain-containing protein n=1 Tax=Wickerhamiella sorbophila TaxID=45607 RepID=A0A2T0FKU3_9ASCO|nr:hypothetical protein B9G98_03234 [Wickerhamiella sorbophila]PRT55614.1 hypothetical protein B9G98_03234 [Wickerhamiella sorbophila]
MSDRSEAEGLRQNSPDWRDYRSLTVAQQQDVRASQRTFDAAYIRTAFSELTFGLIILRLFSKEFLPVGTVYTIQSLCMIVLALHQRWQYKVLFLRDIDGDFVTSGQIVLISGLLAIAADTVLLVIIARMPQKQ